MTERTYPIAIIMRNHVFTRPAPGGIPRVNGVQMLGEHLHGRLSAESARRIAGEDFSHALGAVLHTPDGLELYQIEDAAQQLDDMLQANHIRDRVAHRLDDLEIDDRATVIDLALGCLYANHCPEPSFLIDSASAIGRERLDHLLPQLSRAATAPAPS